MNVDFIEPCLCFDEANLVDKIRQKVISIQSDPILEEITYFLEGSLKYLDNNIHQDIAAELFSDIFTFFKQFTKELMQIFNDILKKSRTNANYIYITSLLLSYLTHEDLNLDIPDYNSFINDTMTEICQQITNQTGKLIIFGHEIAPQFQNDLILNTALSLKLTESISPKLYNYIFYHYWQKNDKRFDLFLQSIITSGLNAVLPQTDSSNEEILEFLSKKDDQIFLKMSTESFSIIKSAIIYIKYESNVQVKGLDERTIFQFATVISVLLRLLKDFKPEIAPFQIFKFVNQIPIDLFTKAANLLQNKESPFLNILVENWPFLTLTFFIGIYDTFDFINVLIQQLINNEYKADKFILINTSLMFFKKDEFNELNLKSLHSSDSKRLSNLFTFIFANLNEFYNYRNNFICESFDLNCVDQSLIVDHFQNLKSENELIQSIYFFEKVCFNQPMIQNSPKFIIKAIEQEIQNENYENLKLISIFLKVNILQNEKIREMKNLPLIIKYGLFYELPTKDEIKEADIDDLLHTILIIEDVSQYILLILLFKLMMKDEDNLYCYLSYLVSQTNEPYDFRTYFSRFSDKIDEYHDTFIKVTNDLFYFIPSKDYLSVRYNFKIENFKISEFGILIISKIFALLKKNPVCNYQAFICLKDIACTVPILFNSNIQQIFDSILEPFNNLYLLFENNKKDEKTVLLTKTAYASLSFLLSTFQSSLVLDHFVKWLFNNIDDFSNSQVFGFIYVLLCLCTENNVFYSFMPSLYKEYNLFEKAAMFLNRKIVEGPNFEKNYKENIIRFLDMVLYGFSTFTPFVVCQNELLAKIENKFTYFYSNIFSSFIKYSMVPLDVVDEDMKKFIQSIDAKKRYWISNIEYRDNLSDTRKFEDFSNELNHYEGRYIPDYDTVLHRPISIRMANLLVMQPHYIYSIILFNNNTVYSIEQIYSFYKVMSQLLLLQNESIENPQGEGDSDVESIDINEYFTPLINQTLFIDAIINQIDSLNIQVECLASLLSSMAKYPIISMKLLEYIKVKIIKFAESPSHICRIIVILSHIKRNESFYSCINDLTNIALTPKCRNHPDLLIKMANYVIRESTKLPIRFIQVIGFLILTKTNKSILAALKTCSFFDQNELSPINDLLLDLFDNALNDYDKTENEEKLLTCLIRNAPFVVNTRKFESLSLLVKEFESLSKLTKEEVDSYDDFKIANKKMRSFDIVCYLLNAIAPNRQNSTNLSSVIDSSALIPSFIKETGAAFWDIYEQHMALINEELNKNPFLLDKKLKFLLNYPEIVDYKIRSSYFKLKMNERINKDSILEFSVDFNNLLESSFQTLHELPPEELLKSFRIKDFNSPAQDFGGVRRSWFSNLAKEIFNQNYGIFDCSTNMRGYKPSNKSHIHENYLEYFKFSGMFIARALIEGLSIDAHLASSFCKQILHRKTSLKDLEDIDVDTYRSCKLILENDASELYLTFSMDVDNFGTIKTIDLKENGSEIPVTNDNKVEFINLKANYILNEQIKEQINAFNAGFDSLIPHEFLRIFTPCELDLLICGVPSIDVNDFINNLTFIEPYNENTHVVKLFIEVIKKWGNEDLAKLLLFMTGSSRVSINGFKEFAEITGEKLKIGPGGKRENWPQAHTCFNELDLPEYQTKEELETNLRRSIEYYNSFGIA